MLLNTNMHRNKYKLLYLSVVQPQRVVSHLCRFHDELCVLLWCCCNIKRVQPMFSWKVQRENGVWVYDYIYDDICHILFVCVCVFVSLGEVQCIAVMSMAYVHGLGWLYILKKIYTCIYWDRLITAAAPNQKPTKRIKNIAIVRHTTICSFLNFNILDHNLHIVWFYVWNYIIRCSGIFAVVGYTN